ncbi:MAG: rod shape-determining protein MreC [Hyphomonadaceae bacterium]|nr:MAG: rod shape-determining protein MreC [Hyphomonadaceae bacterium]
MARRNSMRRGGAGTGTVVSLIGITALASIALTLALTSPRGAVNAAMNDALAWGSKIVSTPVKWAQGGGDWFSSFFTNSDEVQRLRSENLALLEWRDQAKAMAERLDAYEVLHSVQNETTKGEITARMVSENHGPFSDSGIVNAGKNQGVGADWVVVNQYGLLGRVISLGNNSSRILLLTDGESRIPIMGEVSRGRAILTGDKTEAPHLAHLNTPPIIGEGERILTSGDDGVVPRGIAIGVAGRGPDGKWRVRLNSRQGAVDFVRLVPPNNFPPPVLRAVAPTIAPNAAAVPVVNGVAVPASSAAGGAVLPLDANAASIPTAASPSAISQAQNNRAGNRPTQAPPSKAKPKFKVVVKDGGFTPPAAEKAPNDPAPEPPKTQEAPEAPNP